MATPITATTNFQQVVDASPLQVVTFFTAPVSGVATATLPGLYGQGNVILGANCIGTGASLSSFFRVEAVGNTGTPASRSTYIVGTLYSSLAGSGAGVFPGALLGKRLPTDSWLQVTPALTVTASNVGLCVQYSNFGANGLTGTVNGVLNQ